jgi:RimJ/RimL family protein N-acetyltransferase
LIHEADSGTPIGDSGFFYLPDGERVELGYRLKRAHWRRGLATEVAAKWLSVAMEWFGFTEVYAFAHPGNVVSLHIIKKLSFQYSGIERLYGNLFKARPVGGHGLGRMRATEKRKLRLELHWDSAEIFASQKPTSTDNVKRA